MLRDRGRYFKHQIHRLDEVRDYRWLAWADSSVRFTNLGFFADRAAALADLPEQKRVLLVPHPDRNNITEEFEFIQREIDKGNPYLVTRHASEKMPEQMRYFRSRGGTWKRRSGAARCG